MFKKEKQRVEPESPNLGQDRAMRIPENTLEPLGAGKSHLGSPLLWMFELFLVFFAMCNLVFKDVLFTNLAYCKKDLFLYNNLNALCSTIFFDSLVMGSYNLQRRLLVNWFSFLSSHRANHIIEKVGFIIVEMCSRSHKETGCTGMGLYPTQLMDSPFSYTSFSKISY